MKRLYLLGLVLPVLFAGCGHGSRSISVRSSYEADDGVDEVYYEEDVVYVDDDEEDVNYVVYREYFLCTDEEIATIPYYRRYYQVDDDDLFFLFTVSRHTGRPIDVVIRSYHYECDRDYDRVIQTYHVDRDVFFVDVGGTISFEGPVERPYRAWRGRNHHRERFSRDEYRALVTMKIGVEFGDRRPEQVARDIRQYQAAPRRAIYNDRERLGHGGRNVRGGKVTQEAPRVWTMDRERRQEVHVQRKRHAEELRPKFEREHNQRVKEVRQKDGRIRRPENRPEQQKIRPRDEPRRPEEDQRRKKPRNR